MLPLVRRAEMAFVRYRTKLWGEGCLARIPVEAAPSADGREAGKRG